MVVGMMMRSACAMLALLVVALQKEKKAERTKRDAEAAKAEELGLEPPPKKQQKVGGRVSTQRGTRGGTA